MHNLTSLTWRWVSMLFMMRSDAVMRLREIGAALQHISSTLQHLKLEVEAKEHDEWDPQVTTTGNLEALKQFTHLETLEADEVYIVSLVFVDVIACLKFFSSTKSLLYQPCLG